MASHKYGTLVRAHTGAIYTSLAPGKFATCGADATVRVWDETTGLQYELASPDDRALVPAWRPETYDVVGLLPVVCAVATRPKLYSTCASTKPP